MVNELLGASHGKGHGIFMGCTNTSLLKEKCKHLTILQLIPLPVTNWASDEEKFIPNYSDEIIIFFIL